ncbi:MAG TPA: bifunctional enoyl-CoA hydratase/phosphate acetyltransferase [Methylomirabilota bacterium]
MDEVENRTFDEIRVGEGASLTRTLTAEDLRLVVAGSGDVDPAHVEVWGATLIVTLLATKLPGPGAIALSQHLHFRRAIGLGDTVTASITATAKDPATHRVSFDCRCVNQAGEVVVDGSAEVIAGSAKVRRPRGDGLRAAPPGNREGRHRHLLSLTRSLAPLPTAVVHPVDRNSLLGAIEAARAGFIVPVLVGPEPKIRAVAAAEGVDLAPYRLVPTRHSHEAAERAVALARAGEVEALMKGSLHTDELMHEVVAKETGLRTARRITHVFVMDVPTCPRPLFITDAAINIAPDLMAKRDIVQNAIDLAQVLGIALPKVAILSAVETPTPEIKSTIDAAALCKMAERKMITGGLLDGPLAFDNAISEEAAKLKGIESAVAGRADILVVPDLESGNMLAKQLEYLGDAQAAGIVLGARVPIVLTSRADSPATRVVSCAVALVFARRGPKY